MLSLDQPLAHGMDEVRGGGYSSARAHLAGDLSAMVGRMHQDVSQNVLHGVCPRLSLGVLVRNHLGKERRRKTLEVFSPQPAKLCRTGFALREIELGPDRKTLCLLRQSFQPEPLGGKYVRHELQRPRTRLLMGPHCRQHFAVRPCFINKLTTQMFDRLHTRLLFFQKLDAVSALGRSNPRPSLPLLIILSQFSVTLSF